jgi:hypothetical protein
MYAQARKIHWLVAIVVLLVAADTSVAAGFSLRRSEATIRARLLDEVPLGSAMSQVQQQIAQHGWELGQVNSDRGFLDRRTKPSTVAGAKSIDASLGDYRGFPFMVNVTVFWAFDADGSLIDVWVWKTQDSL